MALHLTSCERDSDIPRSVFVELLRKFDRSLIELATCEIDYVCRCGATILGDKYRLSCQEEFAIIETLRDRAS
jgi:hypothetical protein